MEMKHSKNVWPVQAPCQIAYQDVLTGRLCLRPYLDLNKRLYIWGIAFDGMVFKLKHETDGNWNNVSVLKDDKAEAIMPTTAELDFAFNNKQAFNATVDILKAQKIDADYWREGWYWSSEEKGDSAVVVDMSDGRAEIVPKRMNNGYVRFVSRKIHNKPINVRYTLVYLRDGKFEVSLDLRVERIGDLWGLQTGKEFCRLVNEPQKISWYDATALAKQMSTSQIKYFLPNDEALRNLVTYKDAVNDALAILSTYGAQVDLFEDRSWELLTDREHYDDTFVTYFSEAVPKTKPYTCRMFAKSVKHPTVI